jgi:tetratricopeptide (TPR) repeat protein
VSDGRYARVKEILLAALERPASARAAFVAAACPGDPALQAEVESLLAREETPASAVRSGALAREIGGALRAALEGPGPPTTPERIGRYRILGPLGEGGMGEVFRAEQSEPIHRVVALKLVRRGLDSREFIRRFEAERQILARLEHPGIARLIDGGLTEDGVPWFTMEFVDGVPIDRYCKDRALPVPERLRLFRSVCGAVQFAHRNLIVHRDLKPGNILVTPDGSVKLLDFGIAKVLDPAPDDVAVAPMTRTDSRLLTPAYAAPEQVRNEPVTTATDVYSLGVILYELLCGRRPYTVSGTSTHDLEEAILTAQPTPPSAAADVVPPRGIDAARLRRQLAGDLDTICLKALRKEPERRYASVDQLDDDLRRYLEGRPVLARRDTVGYRTAKFVRRHRGAVIATAAVIVVLAGVISTYTVRLREERDRARSAAAQAELEARKANEVAAFVGGLFEASDPTVARGVDLTAGEILTRGARRVRTELATQPEIQAAMLQRIGDIYVSLNRYDDAAGLLDEALAIRRRLHGEAHPDVVLSLRSRGVLYDETGDYPAAESTLTRALELSRRAWRPTHPEVAESMHVLAMLHMHQARYADAERLLREALAIPQPPTGPGEMAAATLRADLAVVLRDGSNQYRTADTMLTQALTIRRRHLGNIHPDVSANLIDLGVNAYWEGRYDVAVSRYREALEVDRRLYGGDHSTVAADLLALGQALVSMGDPVAAEPYLRESLAMRRRVLGPIHRDVATSENDLASLLQARGDLDGAERLYRLSIEHYRLTVGEDHRFVTNGYGNLGNLLFVKGKAREAAAVLREAIRRTAADTLMLARRMQNLALALGTLGQYTEAETLFVRALRYQRDRLPADNPLIGTTLLNLGNLYVDRGRAREAEPRLLEAVEILRRKLRPGHWQVASSLSALGVCRAAFGRTVEAESLLIRGLAGVVSGGGPAYVKTRERARLVRFYAGIGRRADADRIAAGGVPSIPNP